MADDANKTVILALVAAIIISLGGTFVVLNKLAALGERPLITGMATDDTGEVNVTISQTVMIDVNNSFALINFGVCNAPGSGTTTISSYWTESELNSTSDMNCTGTNMLTNGSFIRVHNLGNVEVDIDVGCSTDPTAAGFLGSALADMHFKANETWSGDCLLNLADASWTQFAATMPTDYAVCDRLDKGSAGNRKPSTDIYINLTVPWDADTGGSDNQNTLTVVGTANPV